MEHNFADSIKHEHLKLRGRYYVELFSFVTVFALLAILLIVLATFGGVNLFTPIALPIVWGSALFLYLLFLIIYFPLRFRYLQKKLILTFFIEGQKTGLKLIPNTLGTQNFDYETLLAEASIFKENATYRLGRYEFNKRLVHVLHHEEDGHTFAIIHIPLKKAPYYLQVNNNNFAPPLTYKDTAITKVAFVSPYKLNYYAMEGPTNVRIYLRREIESRFIDILKIKDGVYQYVATYDDEFLLIEDYPGNKPLRLGENYSGEYYLERLHNLFLLQKILTVMLDKGR